MGTMKHILLILWVLLVLGGCSSQEELKLGALQHFNRGNEHFERLDYKRALEEYEQAIALFDEQPSFHYNLGLCYYNLVLYERAEFTFRRATELNPEFGEAWYNLALTLDKLDKSDEAFSAFDRYQQVNRKKKQVAQDKIAKEEEQKLPPRAKLLGQEEPKKNKLPQKGDPIPPAQRLGEEKPLKTNSRQK